MIARRNRFHGQASLRRMHASSKTVRSGMFALKYTTNERRKTYRMAIVVSRKVSKSAVVRNRIRRRLYENVRILSTNLSAPYDLVFVVYDERLAIIDAAELQREVTKLCQKANLTTIKKPDHDIVHTKENA